MYKILILDNQDSFSYNLRHLLLGDSRSIVDVKSTASYHHDMIDQYDALVLSPGPGLPHDHKNLDQCIRDAQGIIPIWGVCLGLQAIAEVFGGQLMQIPMVMHGITSELNVLDRQGLWYDIKHAKPVGRYHSWMVSDENLPACFVVTSRDIEGRIMSLRHASLPIFGVQFHPESYMTKQGESMARRFIDLVADWT